MFLELSLADEFKYKIDGEALVAKQRERTNAENFCKRRAEGKFEEAVIAANNTLAIKRELFEDDHFEILLSHEILATLSEDLERWDELGNQRSDLFGRWWLGLGNLPKGYIAGTLHFDQLS